MQREKNMVKTFEFVYAMIISILLFLVEKNVFGKLFFHTFQVSFFYSVVCTQYFISIL